MFLKIKNILNYGYFNLKNTKIFNRLKSALNKIASGGINNCQVAPECDRGNKNVYSKGDTDLYIIRIYKMCMSCITFCIMDNEQDVNDTFTQDNQGKLLCYKYWILFLLAHFSSLGVRRPSVNILHFELLLENH